LAAVPAAMAEQLARTRLNLLATCAFYGLGQGLARLWAALSAGRPVV
jgi:hypothetical protein